MLAFAVPAGALAQTPGDDQYTDPFGGSQDEGGGTSDGDDAPAEPEPDPAPAPDPAAPAAESAQNPAPDASGGEQLPYSGADAGLLALGGVVLLSSGVALRVRLRDQR